MNIPDDANTEDARSMKSTNFDKVMALSNYKFTFVAAGSFAILAMSIWMKPETAVPLIFGAVSGGAVVAVRK